MTSKHLHELIDTCRPGHDDINDSDFGELASELSHDPKLQRLFERSQEVDEAIRDTFQAVTPPAGLQVRLLDALDSVVIDDGESDSMDPEVERHVERVQRSSRRSFVIWAGVASVAAVAAAIAFWVQLPQPITSWSERDIAESVDGWNTDLGDANWQTTVNIPTNDFPTWQHLDVRSISRWQFVSRRRIACYEFVVPGRTVRLFVMKPTARVALPTAPPAGYPSPNGWHVGAWLANGRVYFLAVHADRDSKRLYSRLIASPITPA